MSSARDYVTDTGATPAKDFAVRGLSERPLPLIFLPIRSNTPLSPPEFGLGQGDTKRTVSAPQQHE